MDSLIDFNLFDKRFIDLETKVSHQDLLLEELHEVLYEQQKSIETLKKKIELFNKRFEESALTSDIRANEKPPHY